jgi:hypothetical protein
LNTQSTCGPPADPELGLELDDDGDDAALLLDEDELPHATAATAITATATANGEARRM